MNFFFVRFYVIFLYFSRKRKIILNNNKILNKKTKIK